MTDHRARHPRGALCRVAIITSTYNAAQHIELCLKSVELQTHPNVFHVIVDGKSDDQTVNIVTSGKSERLFFISEPDNGIYSACNKGIKLIDADWYLFLGADDILLPNAIQALLEQAQASNCINLVTAKALLLADHGAFVGLLGGPFSRTVLWHHMPNANCSTLYHCSFFYSSSCFGESYRSAADYLFLLRNRGRITSVHTRLILSDMRTGGISTSNPRLSLMESLRAKLSSYPRSIHFLIYMAHLLSLTKMSILRFQAFGHGSH